MGAAKKSEVRDLLENLHYLYTSAQEGLVKAQSRLIGLLEDHSALKDELSKSKSNPARPLPSDGHNLPRIGDNHNNSPKEGALIWITGGDIDQSDKSTEYRIKVADKVGAKGGVVITDSFFAKDGRLGARVSDADKARAKEAASLLGYQTKVLGAIDPELFIRDVGDISEEELRDAVGDCCTAVYKKGLNAFVRVRRDGLEDLLSAGIKVGWRLLKPEIRHRKVMCYHCCAIGKSAHLAKDGPNEAACCKYTSNTSNTSNIHIANMASDLSDAESALQ
ncbi:hypothetical protein Pmar_PMAR005468 [Perkinsus marinus ATCC 50983]|uniref:Uncharacterized protein n=1 Tax=Perkinsus marinus (strain ATCC 50983 / TXsc) TaxID=423536 RepID=C5KNC9_PERM5|nr:hypothetical protein Pmar_PMAR005468 [Perkinsus marinus ATCC 50983]EER14023.1 hypothetical protein Pmar_PMAR005468 [Perkinsus marinus ATCC 50983]|eukprot:XP_002782228.1 hypothetical protein Pmar_PMAR005468 [Perkinsus marinus ATCC 50983]